MAAGALAAAGADVIGVNCGGGPEACVESLEAMACGRADPARACRGAGRQPGGWRSIMPNAGLPQRIEGQFVYAASPEYLAAHGAPLPGGRRDGARRLLRHDATAHRGDAAGPRCGHRRRRPTTPAAVSTQHRPTVAIYAAAETAGRGS